MKYNSDEGDPWSVVPRFTENFRRVRAERLQQCRQKDAIFLRTKERLQKSTDIIDIVRHLPNHLRSAKKMCGSTKLYKLWAAVASRLPRSVGEVCFLFSFNGFLLNRHRLAVTVLGIMGACAALINRYTDSPDTNATSGSVYAFLNEHCDRMPAAYYNGAHFDFWTIWLLISLYCGASITFVVGRTMVQAMRRWCVSSERRGLCFVLFKLPSLPKR